MESSIPANLRLAFEQIPDPRRRQGRRFALSAILMLTVAAILANQRSVLAIAEWGASQSRELLAALGFADGITPHQSTLTRLFARLDPAVLATIVGQYLGADAAASRVRGQQGIAIDGKAHRRRQAYREPLTGVVQILSAVCHDTGVVLAQVPIEHLGEQAEAELTVAPQLLTQLDWSGRVLTGDALFCQRALCRQVRAAGGDYLFLVKANQPTLYDDLRLLFDPPAPGAPLQDRREVRTVDQGHGRAEDMRHLVASTDLTAYLDWPGVAQVFRLERTWWDAEGWHQSLRYGITSLPPTVASAERLLALRRGHWSIENRLHYVKDVSLGEDHCAVRRGAGPIILSIIRDTALSIIRRSGQHTIAARLRHYSHHPPALLSLLGLQVP
jgi:predicted transposase YbfD/YdcC